MSQKYVTSTFLRIHSHQVLAVYDWKQQKTLVIDNQDGLTILEIFIHQESVEAAYEKFQKIKANPALEIKHQHIKDFLKSEDFIVLAASHNLQVFKNGFSSLPNPEEQLDLTSDSRETYQVIRHLFQNAVFTEQRHDLNSFESFTNLVESMVELGLLSPSIQTLDLGDLRRRFPICPNFGFTRGTVIDRYYLDKFIGEIREQVVGDVLEIGGVLSNKELFQFQNATRYQTLDIFARPGVTLVGNVHDRSIIEPESLDTVVIFNVLEHCREPWVVVKNIYSWLKVGGQCFAMVPNAQRLHDAPVDYWRPLPDGMKQLFQDFSQQKLYLYGNPLTLIASFMGISAEELSSEELDDFHPDYTVATCLVARK